MMKVIKCIILYIIITFCALAGVTFLYFNQPQYLCYGMYDVKESDRSELTELPVGKGEELVMEFCPQNTYLHDIAIEIKKEGVVGAESLKNTYLDVECYQGKKRIVDEEIPLESNGIVEIPVRKWVRIGEKYQLHLKINGESETVYLVSAGSRAIGPYEQKNLVKSDCVNQEDSTSDRFLYAKFTYIGYSRKLFVLWFMAFWASGGFFFLSTNFSWIGSKRNNASL